jgi:hypothetical protein
MLHVPSGTAMSIEGSHAVLALLRGQARPDAFAVPYRFCGSFRTATLSKTGDRISVGILAQAMPNMMVRSLYCTA